MAFRRAAHLLLLFSLFLQSGHAGFQLSIPDCFGGSCTVESTAANNKVSVSMGFDGDAVVHKVELGPLGGVQSRLVSPLIPNMNNMMAEFQANMQQTWNEVANMFRDPLTTIRNNIDQQLKNFGFNIPAADAPGINAPGINAPGFNAPGTGTIDWDSTFTQIMHDIDTGRFNAVNLINNAGGLLSEALTQGAIAWDKATSVVSAIIRSALQRRENPISTLIDLLESDVGGAILRQSEAMALLARAAQAGLHQTMESSNIALRNFLQASAEADVITEETAAILMNALNPGVATKVNGGTRVAAFNTPISGESAALVSPNFPSIDAVAKSAMDAFK